MTGAAAGTAGAVSAAAMRVLMGFVPRRGATLGGAMGIDEGVLAELSHAGLIGPGGGLTRKGEIARAREIERRMDEAF